MDNNELLRKKINLETATFPWSELLRHFATGNVIAVESTLDLVDVAVAMANDDANVVGQLLSSGKIAKVSDTQAQLWLEQDLNLWTVVVKPWVLVQQRLN
ncbi:DUF2288 domain-containing protein [Undibacterium sp. SXout7W]|uniref:DUF2288 domain-containing protein n=1 Tax=Undibacterium sp. SXout7W TaxID=3413049 RepID=UPI003BEFCEB9